MNDGLTLLLISKIEVNNPALPNGTVHSSYKEHLHKGVTTCGTDGATHSCMLISFCDQQEEAGSYGELHTSNAIQVYSSLHQQNLTSCQKADNK